MSVTLNLAPETERRLQEKAVQAGLSLEEYLQRLAEREARNGAASETAAEHSTLSFEQMTGPLAAAVQAAGLNDREVEEFLNGALKEVRVERRAKRGPA